MIESLFALVGPILNPPLELDQPGLLLRMLAQPILALRLELLDLCNSSFLGCLTPFLRLLDLSRKCSPFLLIEVSKVLLDSVEDVRRAREPAKQGERAGLAV